MPRLGIGAFDEIAVQIVQLKIRRVLFVVVTAVAELRQNRLHIAFENIDRSRLGRPDGSTKETDKNTQQGNVSSDAKHGPPIFRTTERRILLRSILGATANIYSITSQSCSASGNAFDRVCRVVGSGSRESLRQGVYKRVVASRLRSAKNDGDENGIMEAQQ
jgi:hypothetical protein